MKTLSRRNFLKKSSAFGLLASSIQFLPSRIFAKDTLSANNRINIACVGTGNASKGHLAFALNSPRTNLIALCDVDKKALNNIALNINASAKNNYAKAFREVDCCQDYQDVLGRDDIDAVWICTPDHWHVQIAVAALLKGKAVYVEKPISLTVEEGRILANLARKTKGLVQVGSQTRSMEHFRKATHLVRNGYLGKIKRIDVDLAKLPAIPQNLREESIPEGFNYEKWLGQTPWLPYNNRRVQNSESGGWKCFYEYSSREDGIFGANFYDTIQWALDYDKYGATEFFPENYEGELARRFRYDSGETVYVNDNSKYNSLTFEGEDAKLRVSMDSIVCSKSHLLHQSIKSKDECLDLSKDHRENFLDAIEFGQKNIANAETGHRSATICQLMSIAKFNKEYIKWNPQSETIIEGSDKAKSMLSRPRRAPYFIGS